MKLNDEELLDEINSVSGISCLSEDSIRKALSIKDDLKRQQAIITLETEAKSVGQARNFQKLLKIIGQKETTSRVVEQQNYVSTVSGFNITLDTGEWICDNLGVRRYTQMKGQIIEEVASWQPVIISNIYYNQEFNTCRVQLMFKESENSAPKTITVNKSIIANTSLVTSLSDYGISITSQNAPLFVKYLNDLERLNVATIPRSNAISRVGWIGDNSFVPYNSSIHFDGETMYKDMYDAIKCGGDYEEWKSIVKQETSTPAKVVLGASFASPLVGLMNSLTFFTHLWGNSGTGKSVSLYLAESVWGNPNKLVQNLNGTAVALERLAGFFCNLPLCLDELQTLKRTTSKDMSFDDILYRLGQGRGKSRGKKDGSIDRVQSWALSIITTGEEPIVTDNSGGGAKNRVLDVYCKEDIFSSSLNVVKCCKQNFGWAGKEFIEKLIDYVSEKTTSPIEDIYDMLFNAAISTGATEKQAMAASMIVTGYIYMQMFIFGENELSAINLGKDLLDEMKPMLFKITEINNIENTYHDILSFVEQNKHHFMFKQPSGFDYNPIDNKLEVWGKIDKDYDYIANSVVETYCKNNCLSYRKVLQSLCDGGYIDCKSSDTRTNSTRPVRIGTSTIRCVCVIREFNILDDVSEEVVDETELPF